MKTSASSHACIVLVVVAASALLCASAPGTHANVREVPYFVVDPSWPKLPPKWLFGQVWSMSVDEQRTPRGAFHARVSASDARAPRAPPDRAARGIVDDDEFSVRCYCDGRSVVPSLVIS